MILFLLFPLDIGSLPRDFLQDGAQQPFRPMDRPYARTLLGELFDLPVDFQSAFLALSLIGSPAKFRV